VKHRSSGYRSIPNDKEKSKIENLTNLDEVEFDRQLFDVV